MADEIQHGEDGQIHLNIVSRIQVAEVVGVRSGTNLEDHRTMAVVPLFVDFLDHEAGQMQSIHLAMSTDQARQLAADISAVLVEQERPSPSSAH